MKFIALLALALAPWMAVGQIPIAPGATVEKLADGFAFTEGPAADAEGNVYFTDQPNDRIYKWSVDGRLSLFASGMGRSNGMYFDGEGRLVACADMDNQLWAIDTRDGSHTVLVSGFGGKRLNGPNDVWVNPVTGGMYFTDPLYVRKYWTRDKASEQPGEYVYYLAPDEETLTVAATGFVRPNGIVGTPDGKRLYVADIDAKTIYAYPIAPDGTLGERVFFAPVNSDGMTLDERGNLYLTNQAGVTVYDSRGVLLGVIPVGAKWTANVCFGGADGKTLFITASEYLYAIRMEVAGAR